LTSGTGKADMGTGHRVVVVDDDPDIRELLVQVLDQAGHDVLTAETGLEAVDVVRAAEPDLVTLDLSLPDLDGTEVCRRLREFTDAYVIMITGRSSEIDRLVGLEVGADDYMSKPFSPREVRARVAALLRRPRLGVPPGGTPAPAQPNQVGALTFTVDGGVAHVDGHNLPLTPVEVDVLTVLAREPGRTWERGELVREVWQGDFIESDFLVDVHVASLRRKLKAADPTREWITTVGGSGYRLDAP
jgi:DNA-binding response OmpR family regulator